ncbi:MAG TPA: respiratory nitrate reductase subunit gamma [Pyrinomonadaceae bacterium]|jgi:nitrate reductase gamma subunit|nr:respiratory nitrate reductase subunit gamma [Chloracidobacterium sp.]MBP9935939.1 respiratory nitrate reductase subunit gamma [Pyrinomonadaceae bacterium]MBK7801081.1 respiratory nitrate reductase subunit gamma [Chloracidobacterium sp.]MBK9436407.1 respiratory nitrate reductase subunit gamma [Chloracidobacterium sp.]MBL0241387.1 respiratory nitrate reductase subunit gamma [Chloracidobacterium sp.]
MLEYILYVWLPYTAVAVLVVVSIYRFVTNKFSYSSLSSQFLESDELFYGSVPWHIGIIVALTGHLIGFLIPQQILSFNSDPIRLYILEVTGLVFGLMSLIGIVSLFWRRVSTPKIRAVTTVMDIVVLVLLLSQVFLGVYIALFYRWGSSWFAATAVPYLYSLFMFQPDLAMVRPMPLMFKLHIIGAFLILLVFPFSRLVHMVSLPITYLWRPYQLVRWNWDRKTIRGQYTRHDPKAAGQTK